MPDLGIGETLAAVGDAIGSLFGGAAAVGASAAPAAEAVSTLGALGPETVTVTGALAPAAAAPALSLADLAPLALGGTAAAFAGGPGGGPPSGAGVPGAPAGTQFAQLGQAPTTVPQGLPSGQPSPMLSDVGAPGTPLTSVAGPSAVSSGNLPALANVGSPDLATTATGLAGSDLGSFPTGITSGAGGDIPDVGITPSLSGFGGSTGFVGGSPTAAATPPGGILGKGLEAAGINTSSGFGKTLADNANLAIPALGLGYSALNQRPLPEAKALASEATTLGNQATQLSSYLSSGTLPPGAQTAIDQATKAANATIRSKYAAMGLTGSTMEADELNTVKQNATSQAFGFADQLLAQGIQEAGMVPQIYNFLLQNTQQQNNQLMSSIANFAAIASGGPFGGLTVNLPGSKAA